MLNIGKFKLKYEHSVIQNTLNNKRLFFKKCLIYVFRLCLYKSVHYIFNVICNSLFLNGNKEINGKKKLMRSRSHDKIMYIG